MFISSAAVYESHRGIWLAISETKGWTKLGLTLIPQAHFYIHHSSILPIAAGAAEMYSLATTEGLLVHHPCSHINAEDLDPIENPKDINIQSLSSEDFGYRVEFLQCYWTST